MKVDQFLEEQEIAGVEVLATLQRAAANRVKVTPYLGGGCNCASSIELDASAIEHVEPTGKTVWCCDHQLKLAKVTIRRDATLPVHDVLRSMSQQQGGGGGGGPGCKSACFGAYKNCLKRGGGDACDDGLRDCIERCNGVTPEDF